METFNTIVSVCSGVSVIVALMITLIKPLRERIMKTKERDNKCLDNFKAIKADIQNVKDDVDKLQNSILEDKALRSRTQILRFSDEIYQGTKHTKEHFDEILDAMTFYNKYCDLHPDFKNFRTENAQKVINHIYEKCQLEHSFLGTEDNDNVTR